MGKNDAAISVCLAEISARLEEAASIGRAANAAAEAGLIGSGLNVALDIEQLLYEASTLLNAASLLHRIARAT